ncbi:MULTISPECIES: aldehyde dehydrogenase family protein [Nocardiopsis]|uniref:Aldehyde Dehydrogenase n=1 Tax=Nocardiopsis dassonvillei (strain ATCC 23218 / DSM 43111 / CIP 107115 / JCM 7437 / KCTC 9190 / NBRC 14626 / NCTC 10488 / NRRL B-5397 / IMRU 509) TaxID=446468 RepID=D7B3P8_NOCDD|nr:MULTISPECIES: aldehyde dehydrogenase family protein [Nocardiopsis]ADH68815.1 Aldehyde Dehydrogenase [Nocardiopsis dassonvillei subsp. dassonvillei DSM 43111]APC36870.1 aldehyde dehydrogenase family protein [Nocardiopsis dassonvillei]NKY80217.1 aldehyde dehydrogenase family protein [Nocardiopsis dassonvillei]VEI89324.1 Putative aldehyde dehydrogenase SA1924 [Nocardiopsis dassonvillei]
MRSLYIDGAWRDSASSEALDVVNPATEQVIDTVPAGAAEDVDAAVAAAAAALPAWSALTPGQRVTHLAKALELFNARIDDIAAELTRDMGAPAVFARKVQAGLPALMFQTYIDLVEESGERYFGGERVGNSLIVREPVGVVGAITPWNYPLHQIVLKVVPALLAGNTVVLKPSEVAPLSAYALTEVFHEAGLPAGVFNLVSGTGPVVGEAIAAHPRVDMVSFTGSTRAGTRVSQVAAETVKKVALELGGKSPNVILPDADLVKAVKRGVADVMRNTGQSCNALTRMLVHRDSYEEAVALAAESAAKYAPGDPADEATRMGPLVSADQLERVRSYLALGVEEGARLVTGGPEPVRGRPDGYYVNPTVFADVSNDMRVAQEEIFGPVLVLIPYDTEEEAVAIANDTVYGLNAAVWSGDPERGLAVARRLRAGQVEVNGGALNPRAPFGGYKRSGNGREWGAHGLEEFCEVKAVQL